MSVAFHILTVADVIEETDDAHSIRFTVTMTSWSWGATQSE